MPEPRHELAALIDRVRDANGWSDSEIVARATRGGHKLSKSNLSRIRNTDVATLTGSTIRALAAGLDVPAAEVARAALKSMGIELPELGQLDLGTAVKLDATLSKRDKVMLLELLRTMRAPAPDIVWPASVDVAPSVVQPKFDRPELHDAGKVSSALQSPAGGRGDTRRRRKGRNVPQPRHPVRRPEPAADGGSEPVYDQAEELAAWRMSPEEMEIAKRSRPGDEDYPADPPNDDDEGR